MHRAYSQSPQNAVYIPPIAPLQTPNATCRYPVLQAVFLANFGFSEFPLKLLSPTSSKNTHPWERSHIFCKSVQAGSVFRNICSSIDWLTFVQRWGRAVEFHWHRNLCQEESISARCLTRSRVQQCTRCLIKLLFGHLDWMGWPSPNSVIDLWFLFLKLTYFGSF